MSGPDDTAPDDTAENFLRRWSQRKQAARDGVRETVETSGSAKARPELSPGVIAPADVNGPGIDPASLPPVESINAASDIRAFLAPGVPGEVTRAALRRAWVTDPTIRDFIGLAENQWDFTRPDGVPGFGSLELTPELRRMVARLVGDAGAETGVQTAPTHIHQAPMDRAAEGQGQAIPTATDQEEGVPSAVTTDDILASDARQAITAVPPRIILSNDAEGGAPQRQTDGLLTSRRRHGGAIPK